jgi:hypothetical protein
MASADFCSVRLTLPLDVLCAESLGFGGDSIPFEVALSPTPLVPCSAPGQISPDKNGNCRYATVSFSVFPEPLGFVVLCQLALETRPSMTFLFVSS